MDSILDSDLIKFYQTPTSRTEIRTDPGMFFWWIHVVFFKPREGAEKFLKNLSELVVGMSSAYIVI